MTTSRTPAKGYHYAVITQTKQRLRCTCTDGLHSDIVVLSNGSAVKTPAEHRADVLEAQRAAVQDSSVDYAAAEAGLDALVAPQDIEAEADRATGRQVRLYGLSSAEAVAFRAQWMQEHAPEAPKVCTCGAHQFSGCFCGLTLAQFLKTPAVQARSAQGIGSI